MKPKPQSNVYPLRFDSAIQRDKVKKAADLRGQTMRVYILRATMQQTIYDLKGK